MKIKVIDLVMKPRSIGLSSSQPPMQLATFWCAGCGQFHGFPVERFNGDVDNPSTLQPVETKREGHYCHATITEGVVAWDILSTHHLAGKSRPMQHEEAWRDGGHLWDEVKP